MHGQERFEQIYNSVTKLFLKSILGGRLLNAASAAKLAQVVAEIYDVTIAIFTGPTFKDSGAFHLWGRVLPSILAELEIELMDKSGIIEHSP